MKTVALPQASGFIVFACLAFQVFALYSIATRHHASLWLAVVAFFIGGFITDLISGLFHFSFDYVWPPNVPILGPIAVEFQQHHADPTLDPSALASNFTKGAYGALPLALIAILVNASTGHTAMSLLLIYSLMATSLWMLGFHQIHAYAHLGSQLPPEDFKRAVYEISQLPRGRQKEEFAKLFETINMPRSIRFLQRCRLFLRPEVHWQHHLSFETDFSSVNGWSDPVMNWLYKRLVRWMKAKRAAILVS